MGMETLRPEEIIVNLPGFNNTIDIIKVTRFDFMTQVQSLLDDSVLNRDANLVINSMDRFQKYFPPDGQLGECLSGRKEKGRIVCNQSLGNCVATVPHLKRPCASFVSVAVVVVVVPLAKWMVLLFLFLFLSFLFLDAVLLIIL
jgi:hypothetical protein